MNRKIHHWSASRSAGAITIDGRTPSGEKIKLTGVSEIRADAPWPIAVDPIGDEWQLVCGELPTSSRATPPLPAGIELAA